MIKMYELQQRNCQTDYEWRGGEKSSSPTELRDNYCHPANANTDYRIVDCDTGKVVWSDIGNRGLKVRGLKEEK